jgi:hypothetical protein
LIEFEKNYVGALLVWPGDQVKTLSVPSARKFGEQT